LGFNPVPRVPRGAYTESNPSFRTLGLGSGFRVKDSRIEDSSFRFQGSGFRVQGLGFRV
jgi:hypothetical protein